MGSFLMICGFLVLSVLLACTGALMLLRPRQFAVACEAFAAAGNLPSVLPQSVKRAWFQIRAIGGFFLVAGLVLMSGTASLMQTLLGTSGIAADGKLYWLVVPAALGISAGYVILAYGSEWVAHTFGKWVDHPLVPQEITIALTWELRIAGGAFLLFGLGAGSMWLRSLLRS
ncbi:MAG TPA: hypothetical protein VNJ52_02605 [Patescibacteria group bacterium]|nr:hypothetical protein [Patescibacteria group bacterium]